MRLALHFVAGASMLLAHAPASAQQLIFDSEPNASKADATPALDLVDGDIVIATGFGGCGSGPPDVDYFRMRTAPLPMGIYRHDLVDVGGNGGTEMYLVGVDAIQETTIPGSYDYIQNVPVDGTGTKFLSWYGFGKSEEVYTNLFQEYSCRTSIETTLRTTPVQAVDLGVVTSSNLTASSPGANRDLELHLFDAEFNAVPRMNIDRIETGSITLPADVGPGTYYAAVSDHNLATHLPHYITDFYPGESRTLAGALDFPGAAANGSPEVGFDVQFAAGTVSAMATKTDPYQILWFRFELGVGQYASSFCTGDGATASCPLGNDAPGNSGMGCLNSTGRGGTLISRRARYFTLEDLPAFSTVLMFAGPSSMSASPAASGLFCIGPGSVRIGPTSASFAGTAVLDPGSPNMTNLGMAGMTIYTQAAYRDVGSTVNFTNGLQVTL